MCFLLSFSQALGYIVFAAHKSECGIEYARFLVQSNKVASPSELIDRTEAFLTSFLPQLEAMPADKFTANVEAVVSKKLEADKNLQEESSRLWNEIRDGTLDFAQASQEIAALRALSQVEFVAWFKAVIAPGGSRRRFFASLVEAGKGGPGAAEAAAAALAAAGNDSDNEEEGMEEGGDEDMGPEDGEDIVAAEDDVEAEGGQAEAAVTTDAGGSEPAGAVTSAPVRDDKLAPVGAPSAAAAVPGASPPAVSALAERLKAITIELTSAQAAAIQHVIRTHEHLSFPSKASDEVVKAAFSSLGIDISAQLAAAAAAPSDAIRVRVSVPAYTSLRPLLPVHIDIGAVRAAAWKARAGLKRD